MDCVITGLTKKLVFAQCICLERLRYKHFQRSNKQQGAPYSLLTLPRSCLVAERWLLPSSRRCRDP